MQGRCEHGAQHRMPRKHSKSVGSLGEVLRQEGDDIQTEVPKIGGREPGRGEGNEWRVGAQWREHAES